MTKPVLVGLIALMLVGCVSIPEGATATSQTVTIGVDRLMDQHIATARALAESARHSVWQAWDNEILDKVIADELQRAGTTTLTADQAATAAATAADVREKLISQINNHEIALLAQIETNYRGIVAINNVVTGYLASAEKLKDANDSVSNSLLSIAGIEFEDIPEPVRDLLAISESPNGDD